jgi:hypothetical protein
MFVPDCDPSRREARMLCAEAETLVALVRKSRAALATTRHESERLRRERVLARRYAAR